jgi:hypothetical protein
MEAWSNDNGPFDELHKVVEEKTILNHPLKAIARLTCRPWWYRVWVLQELLLAKNVSFFCVFSSISFANFAEAIVFFATALFKLAKRVKPGDLEDPINGPELTKIFISKVNSRSGHLTGGRRRYHSDSGSHEALIRLLRGVKCVSTSLRYDLWDAGFGQ